MQTKYQFIFSLTLWCVAIIAPVTSVQAQSVDLSVDVGLLSGVQLGQSGDSTVVQRQSTALTFDINTVFDNDIVEWSLGLIMQLEAPIAAGAYPKIRVVKKRQADAIYAQLGVPWYLSPFRRFGVGLGGGYRHLLSDGVYFFGQGSTEFYFAGGDIPTGESILAFSACAGGRVTF
ncbi:MAG: hypothetical protein ACPGQS_10705 [Bradymonadia bacterium]